MSRRGSCLSCFAVAVVVAVASAVCCLLAGVVECLLLLGVFDVAVAAAVAVL